MRLRPLAVGTLALVLPFALGAQVLDLTIHDRGIAIGDKPRVYGMRFNYRDERLQGVYGANITIWSPYAPAHGVVNGLALGLPMTGARDINGFGIGLLGVGAEHSVRGLGVGLVGVGSGSELQGLMIGGIGVGSGGAMRGISIGGIGVGGGGSMTGIQIGGIGVGGGGKVTGLSIGGIGVGGGGSIEGITLGGIGVGSGGTVKGIQIGGIGVGSGSDITGLSIGGIGVGAGGLLKGVAIGGIGVGAPKLEGLMIGGIGVGGQDAHVISIAPVYFKIEDNGHFEGGSLSAVNYLKGEQRGLTIGLVNFARELHGAQIGLINISDNGGNRRILPIISVR